MWVKVFGFYNNIFYFLGTIGIIPVTSLSSRFYFSNLDAITVFTIIYWSIIQKKHRICKYCSWSHIFFISAAWTKNLIFYRILIYFFVWKTSAYLVKITSSLIAPLLYVKCTNLLLHVSIYISMTCDNIQKDESFGWILNSWTYCNHC